ncbi:reverse transcriptase domain-containing protein [Tanacetum coccineum]|uniref:Reverse transcriptase domain-containing protein n=1 Tax=Tanacetum coccineum TaxID=301880 RepID=A0ABQ5HX94_9ASTR
MCVDFTDLNKSCPKECYPLSEIDWKIESLYGYPFKCFMDDYKGYHQIHMAEEDEEKTVFHTSQGVYYYIKMSFGIKNAGATYQWLVDKAFEKQISTNLEVYVDDLVIKSYTEPEILKDIEVTFQTLRNINMKLNPKKCAFEAEERMFLGHVGSNQRCLVNRKRLEADANLSYGSSRLEGSGAGLILTNLKGMEFTYALRFEFVASNNEALVAGLRIAEQMGVKNLAAKVDSLLVANQINGSYIAKEKSMIQYLEKAKALIIGFTKFSIEQVSRSENKKANALGKYVVREIHEGSCSMHFGSRSIVAKAIRSGYYWPTMHKDARNIIRKCDDCQVHHPVPRNPQQKLTLITSPWPLYKWGIDILGPFPEAQGKVKFLIVAIDYFTKWIKANPVATMTGKQIKKFVWDNIVEEVPHLLWAHRTMIKTSNGYTPFSLTYDTEVVIPVEIGMPSLRCVEVDQVLNDEALLLNLDMLEEKRERATIREAKSKAKMENYYNANVRSTAAATKPAM